MKSCPGCVVVAVLGKLAKVNVAVLVMMMMATVMIMMLMRFMMHMVVE